MKKFIVVLLVLILSSSVSFAGGDKVRGEKGSGTTTQDFCGPDNDCAGDPYWWPEL